jgi:hypothetical protein
MFFNLKPGYAIGPATQFVETTAKQILPSSVQGALQGEALTFRNTASEPSSTTAMSAPSIHAVGAGNSATGDIDPNTGGQMIRGVLWKENKAIDLGTLGGLESEPNFDRRFKNRLHSAKMHSQDP